ncbi:GUK1 family protein [Megaselia abdita]
MLTVMAIVARAFISYSAKRGPRPLVICGPSGSGKSTLLKRLFAEYPETFGFSVSHTTRKPRAGEQNGVHYHFVSAEQMSTLIGNDEFIETATFSGNQYGTSKQAVYDVQAQGKVCVLDIEIQGVEQIKKSHLDPVYIFNMPPTVEDLEKRLKKRGTETEETLAKRLEAAGREMAYGQAPGNFDIIVVNDDLDRAYEEFRNFIVTSIQKQISEGINVKL